jgi:dsRNA-specific ribonuclease
VCGRLAPLARAVQPVAPAHASRPFRQGRCEAPAPARPCSAGQGSTGPGRARPARRRYKFRNSWMLRLALLHLSAVQASTAVQIYHKMPVQNQTPATMLPLIGDSVLGLLVVEALCAAYPTARVGELTRAKHSLCCREACFECAPARTRQGCFQLSGSLCRGGRLRGRARSAAATRAARAARPCFPSCSVCRRRGAGCAPLQCHLFYLFFRWGSLQRCARAPGLQMSGRLRLHRGVQAGRVPGGARNARALGLGDVVVMGKSVQMPDTGPSGILAEAFEAARACQALAGPWRCWFFIYRTLAASCSEAIPPDDRGRPV